MRAKECPKFQLIQYTTNMKSEGKSGLCAYTRKEMKEKTKKKSMNVCKFHIYLLTLRPRFC